MSAVVTPQLAPPELEIEDLKLLMRSVNETTQRLQHTHAALQEQVACLQNELAEANAQLRRSRSLAALGEMAAGIAHEVRNPLGSIGLYIQMLAEDVAGRRPQVELCEKIARAVEDLDAIVRDVLLFAKDSRLDPQPCTAEALIERALTNCQSLLADGGIEVVSRPPAGTSCRLEADPCLLVQSLGNVIRNAVEAMVESTVDRRELRLGAFRERRRCPDGRRALRIVFAVTDTGPGITRKVLDRMFNPFFTTRKTGTGLGLAIVHRTVDAHGGHVTVSNRPEGGASVELCLPPRPVESNGPPKHAGGRLESVGSGLHGVGVVMDGPTTETEA